MLTAIINHRKGPPMPTGNYNIIVVDPSLPTLTFIADGASNRRKNHFLLIMFYSIGMFLSTQVNFLVHALSCFCSLTTTHSYNTPSFVVSLSIFDSPIICLKQLSSIYTQTHYTKNVKIHKKNILIYYF